MRLSEYVGLWGRHIRKQGGPLFSSSKSLIKLYVLRTFFIISLTVSKRLWKSKIFWRLNEKVPACEAATSWNRGISCNLFENTNPIEFLLFIFVYFVPTVSKRVPKVIFLDIKFKSFGLRGNYSLIQGNTLQNLWIVTQILFFLSPDLLF